MQVRQFLQKGLKLGILTIAGLSAACGEGTSDSGEDTSAENVELKSSESELYYLSTGIWNKRDVSVCFNFTGSDTEKLWIRQAVRGQRSWAAAGNINFVGFGQCGTADIQINSATSMSTSRLGAPGPITMNIDLRSNVNSLYTRCTTNGLNREQCIKTVTLHEFGHAIAIAHEQNRSDTPSTCTAGAQGTNGNTTYGGWDANSIMNYCNAPGQLSGQDRRGTDRMYGQYYGDTRRLADFSGDGRDDILCHDVVSGYKWIDFADSNGQFTGTNWERNANWCSHDTARLFKGDFNGDGRDDLLCHDISTGFKWVDYADANGQFHGTDWQRNANWCNHATARLFVGDFNADGREDMLCHDVSTGFKWIDYADANGQFLGTDWQRNANWCSHSTARLFVGDFNADNRDDLLCHDVSTGYKWVDYADGNGQFTGTNWERNANWCNHATAELVIGDFNADNRDDLLCHDVATGYKWIDYADGNGQFTGTNWERNANWCSHSAARLFVGDLNGDNRDDLLCHDVATGFKWVDYADGNGQFLGTDWQRAANWCSHDSAEVH